MRLSRLIIASFLILVVTSSFVTDQRNNTKCDVKVTYKVKAASKGKRNGEIVVTASKGVEPYKIYWMGFPEGLKEGAKMDNLGEGFYTVQVVDADNCVKIVSNIKVESI